MPTTRILLDVDLRELNTILAALTAWTEAPAKNTEHLHIAEAGGPRLTADEIEALCGRLNSSPGAEFTEVEEATVAEKWARLRAVMVEIRRLGMETGARIVLPEIPTPSTAQPPPPGGDIVDDFSSLRVKARAMVGRCVRCDGELADHFKRPLSPDVCMAFVELTPPYTLP